MDAEVYTVKIVGLLDERIRELNKLAGMNVPKILAEFLKESVDIAEYFRDILNNKEVK